jgi:branched-chain amino acid transport system ATP-binding protein
MSDPVTVKDHGRGRGRPPILQCRGLSAGYGAVPVIHDLDIDVHEGEVVALLGPNGAGKSTTLLTLCGHVGVMSGTVSIDGKAASGPLHRRCRAGIALVPEARAIFPSLTTAQNLRLGRGDVEAAVAHMPELRPLLRRKAGLLSGGEQQILVLARALAAQPRVLVADELSLGLAPMAVDRLLRAARRAADDGIGVLLVEQYARRALAVADYVYVLRRGRIALAGPASEISRRLGEVEGVYLSAG